MVNDHVTDEAKKSRRVSMEQMDLIKMTPDAKKAAAAASKKKNTDDKENNSSLNKSGLLDEEDFFDFITRFQSKRMDDQRCSLTVPSARGKTYTDVKTCKFNPTVFDICAYVGNMLNFKDEVSQRINF